ASLRWSGAPLPPATCARGAPGSHRASRTASRRRGEKPERNSTALRVREPGRAAGVGQAEQQAGNPRREQGEAEDVEASALAGAADGLARGVARKDDLVLGAIAHYGVTHPRLGRARNRKCLGSNHIAACETPNAHVISGCYIARVGAIAVVRPRPRWHHR